MKKNTNIIDFVEGEKIQGFYLCTEKYIRQTRSKDLYLDIMLRDKTGKISGKIWENMSEFNEKFKAGEAVALDARVDSYLSQLQLTIFNIQTASLDIYKNYGFDPVELVPCSSQDPNQMWQKTINYFKNIHNPHLKKLVTSIYKIFKNQILIHPASVIMHHNYRSGYLEHILSMLEIAENLRSVYPVDMDLVIAGIAFHDIGKLKEISDGYEAAYTDDGNFTGHIVLGRDMVMNQINKMKNFPLDLRQKIDHIILSHHGTYEWQTPKKPKFPEALLIHHIDHMDAKMNMMLKAIREDRTEGVWTSRRNYFKIPLYKGSHAT